MLTFGKVLPGNAGYYQSTVVAGVEDYYAGDGDAPVVWVGCCDLVGAVASSLATAVDSRLLLEAKCARDGSRLGRTMVSERSVTAFDLTFSAPKSASVLYALGDPVVSGAVEASSTAAVDQAIASLSSRIAYTRTGHAGAAVVDTDGVFGVRYRHRTSRALDPQLHDHVLICNAVRTVSDGEWRTLDARCLYRNAKAAGVEFQSFFRAALGASLGVEFGEVDANGQADIVGIDQAVLAEFSTRSVDIENELARWTAGFVAREGRDPTSAEVGKTHKTITVATRPGKPDEAGLATSTLRAGWRARAERLVDVDQMIDRVCGKMASPAVIVCPTVDEVLEAVGTRHGEWSEAQLIEQIAMRTTGLDPAAVADTIEHVRAEAMASAGVVDLCPEVEPGDMVRASDGRPVGLSPSAVRYTTASHLRREVELVEWAATPAMARHQRHVPVAEAMMGLDRGQADAVTAMLKSTRPVVAVVGPAGAGKTRMLAAAVDAWRCHGVAVFGVAPSAASAQQLADGARTAADTLHKLVYEHHTKWVEQRQLPDPQWWLPAGSVVIIDEAGMVDTRLLHTYAQIALRNHWRTILVGDHRQLDAIDAGFMFAELVEHPDVLTAELDTVHRFDHQWEANASLQLRDGDPAAIDRRLTHGPDDDWVRNGDRWTVIAATRHELHLEHRDTETPATRQAVAAAYIEAGNVAVDYASTIHRVQGATVDEAHLIVAEHTDAKQLYVGTTRGRAANHIHVHPPAFDDEHHGPTTAPAEWSPTDSVAAALQRHGTTSTALTRRRQLRNEVTDSRSDHAEAASMPEEQRLAALRNRRRTSDLSR